MNVQLRQLEAEGLVRRARTLVRNGPGKPANLYEAAPGNEDASSSAYQVVLAALLGELGSRLPPAKLSDILEQTGQRLAPEAKLNPTAGFDTALRAALAALERLGGSKVAAEKSESDSKFGADDDKRARENGSQDAIRNSRRKLAAESDARHRADEQRNEQAPVD